MKYLAIAVFGLLGLAILYLGVQLGPAHLQIRAIDVEIPTLDAIAKLQSDKTETPQLVTFVSTAQQSSERGTIGHVGVLVTWLDGRQLLIDTGMNREAAVEFGKLVESMMGADPVETFGPLEEQLEGEVDNIDGIVFTHLHIDHTQGVTAVCSAMTEPARIFQTRDQAKEHNLHTKAGQALVAQARCEREVLEGETIKPLRGFPGVYAIAAGGHTPGSTIIIVVTNEQTWIFSGDLTNDIASIHENAGKGWLYSYFFVPENTALLEGWRLWLRNADEMENVSVLPAHDIDHMREKLQELN